MALTIFPNVLFKYLLPEEVERKSNKKLKSASIVISISIAILGLTLTPSILPEIFPKYADSVEAIQIMSLAVIPITVNMIYTSQLLGLEKSKFVLIGRLVALVTIIIATIILGTFYELIGLALAFLLTSILQAAVSAYANYRLKISP
jgi:O-antigen/teichoic acid export membrane protein